MGDIVSIKGREYGLEIVLNPKATYPVLREELMQKLQKNKAFFSDSETKVAILGKKLSDAQKNEIKRVFAMDFGIKDVIFEEVPSHKKEVEQKAQKEEKPPLVERKTQEATAESIFINNTIRSGQRIESEGDIVVVGDVNPGGEVIAAGSIAVFGKLRGLVHAGCFGRTDVCVAAVVMCPKQLRISGRVISFPKDRESTGPEVAELVSGKLVIRPC